MARRHRIFHANIADPASGYEELVDFTADEESATDAEDAAFLVKRDAAIATQAEKDGLQEKIDDGTIVFDELVRFLQL
jgi:hypothetical protein